MSQDVLIAELEQRVYRADNHARDRDTVTASPIPPTKLDHLDAITVKTIIVPHSSDTERTFTVILANEAQAPSLGTRTRHWGNYKGLNRFRVFEEMRAEINTLKETTAVQDPNFHLKKLSLQD